MKKERLIKIGRLLFLTVLTVLSIVSVGSALCPDLMEPVLAFMGLGSSGFVMANIAIPGTQTLEKTEENNPGHLKRSMSQAVTKVKPDEYPLDTMLRSIRESEQVKHIKHEYETVKYRERTSSVSSAFVAADSAADESVVLQVNNVRIWGTHDTAYVPAITGADGKELRLFVMAVDRANNTITVTASNSPTADTQRVPSLALNTELKRMGTAKSEEDATTDIISGEPSQDFNYCQIQMCFLEQSVIRSLVESESGYAYKDKKLQELYNMRSSCEATHLYGVKSKTVNKITDKLHYTADGIKVKIAGSGTFKGNDTTQEVITSKDVTALLEQVFAGNNGSPERLLLGGSTLIRHLQDIKIEKQLGSTQIKVKHGVSVLELETNFGILNIKHSKTMDDFGDKEVAMILDLGHIYKHDFEKMKSKQMDPDSAGIRRVKDSWRIHETSCVTTRHPDAHLIWKRDASNSN